ncbi:hypothetical protein PENTCL1PPCAC_13153, partial [Pristionchus entomophagus]
QKARKMSRPRKEFLRNFFTITLPINREIKFGQTLISPTHRIGGLNWHLHVKRCKTLEKSKKICVALMCDKDGSSEVWRIDVKIQMR